MSLSRMDLFHRLSPALQEMILQGPALPPPPGVSPTTDRRNVGWVVVVMCSVLITFSVIVRLYSKIFITKKFMLEDCKIECNHLCKRLSNI